MSETFVPESPVRSPENAPFFDAAREGKLLAKKCDACAEVFFYPRALCPFCMSESSWIETAGTGVIYSHSEVHMKGSSYMLAMVTLDEGPTMMTNIQADDFSKIAVGQKVRVQFVDTNGEEKLAIFVPA
jgi:uncharacterized OB-fold protein